eukprot:jgi/Bigna1/84438/fgenesh1_pg.138_\
MIKLDDHFSKRPLLVASRLAKILGTFARVAAVWKLDSEGGGLETTVRRAPQCDFEPSAEECQSNDLQEKYRGKILRDAITSIGVLFIKLGQTAATRPDLIGEEAAQALEKLQDRTAPFSDKIAKRIIDEEIGLNVFEKITAAPVAAASLAQVYKATLFKQRVNEDNDDDDADDRVVAIKVRRPGLVDQVAIDSYIVRLILRIYTKIFAGADRDYELLFNEVGSGLLEELDFRQEAHNAKEFAAAHSHIAFLRVPRSLPQYVTERVLTLEWIDGRKLTDLPAKDQRKMVQMGIDICFSQLLSTGIVHADPHYGNMLYDNDGKLVLLDFGLVTRVTQEQKEAMAGSIVHTLDEDWEGLIEDYRTLGLLPSQPAIWADKYGNPQDGLGQGVWKDVTEDEFLTAFKTSLDADSNDNEKQEETLYSSQSQLQNDGEKKKKRKRTFSEITTRLTELSFQYRFTLPEWMLFIIRSVITLDGFAGRMTPPFNALELAYPHALRRALTPTTKKGQDSLISLVLTKEGDLNIDRLKGLFSDNNNREDSSSSSILEEAAGIVEAQRTERMDTTMQEGTSVGDNTEKGEEENRRQQQQQQHLTDVIKTLLSSPDGAALRRIIYQLNTERLLRRLLGYVSPMRFKAQSQLDYQISHMVRGFIKNQVFATTQDEEAGIRRTSSSSSSTSNKSSRSSSRRNTGSDSSRGGGSKVCLSRETMRSTSTSTTSNTATSSIIATAAVDARVTPEERERRWRRVQKILTRVHIKRCLSNPKAVLTVCMIAAIVAIDVSKTLLSSFAAKVIEC